MRNGHDYAAQADPARNRHFSRTWGDDPLRLSGFRHLDREIEPQAVEELSRKTIGAWLSKASNGHGTVATNAFRQADLIRRKMGLAWADLIDQRSAA